MNSDLVQACQLAYDSAVLRNDEQLAQILRKALRERNVKANTITVTIEAGMVQEVKKPGHLEHVRIEVRDYDIGGDEDVELQTDERGNCYAPQTY